MTKNVKIAIIIALVIVGVGIGLYLYKNKKAKNTKMASGGGGGGSDALKDVPKTPVKLTPEQLKVVSDFAVNLKKAGIGDAVFNEIVERARAETPDTFKGIYDVAANYNKAWQTENPDAAKAFELFFVEYNRLKNQNIMSNLKTANTGGI